MPHPEHMHYPIPHPEMMHHPAHFALTHSDHLPEQHFSDFFANRQLERANINNCDQITKLKADHVLELAVLKELHHLDHHVIEVPVDRIVERVVEKERVVNVEVPVERVVEKLVQVPVDRVVEKHVEKV